MALQSSAALAKIAELIQQDPAALAKMAAQAGLLPPQIPDTSTPTPVPPQQPLEPLPPVQEVGVVPSPPAVALAPGLPGGPLDAQVGVAQAGATPAGVDPKIASFLKALQGIQAPADPRTLPQPDAPGVPRGQIPAGSEELIARLIASAQTSVPQAPLGNLILGL